MKFVDDDDDDDDDDQWRLSIHTGFTLPAQWAIEKAWSAVLH